MEPGEYLTNLKLIALNGRDVGGAIMEYINPPEDTDVNHLQAKMLGWIILLHIQTGKILESYEELPQNEIFQGMVHETFLKLKDKEVT